MYTRKSRGPRTDPCGTPKLTLSKSDEILLVAIPCITINKIYNGMGNGKNFPKAKLFEIKDFLFC